MTKVFLTPDLLCTVAEKETKRIIPIHIEPKYFFFGDFAEEGGGSGGGGGGGECSGCSPEFKRLSKSGSSSKSSSMCYEMVERKGTYDEAVGYCRGQGG